MTRFERAVAVAHAWGYSVEETIIRDRRGVAVHWQLWVGKPLGNGIANQVTNLVSIDALSGAIDPDDVKVEVLAEAVRRIRASIVQSYDDYELLKTSGIKP